MAVTDMATTDRYQNSDQVRSLLERYFDLGSWEIEPVLSDWLQRFEVAWIHSAVVEALYQGRYKLVSVNQILSLWSRRGGPVRHYSREFESIISGQPLLFSPPKEAAPEAVETLRKKLKETSDFPASHLSTPPMEEANASVNASASLLSQPDAPEPSLKTRSTSFVNVAAHDAAISSGVRTPSQELSETTAAPHEVSEQGLLKRWHNPCAAESRPETEANPGPESSAIEPFRPLSETRQKTESWLGSPVDITTGHPEPIQTFVPQVNPSGFEQRLQAVARRPDRKPSAT